MTLEQYMEQVRNWHEKYAYVGPTDLELLLEIVRIQSDALETYADATELLASRARTAQAQVAALVAGKGEGNG